MAVWIEIVIVLALILLNGFFALSEMALVSARRARLAVLAKRHLRGAAHARRLIDQPQRFLPTVQVGITLVGIVTGAVGGAHITARLAQALARVPAVAPIASSLAFVVVVLVITFFSLVLGELVPKQIALSRAELMAARVAGPLAALGKASTPIVWLLQRSTALVLRALGVARIAKPLVSEEELKALLAEGAQEGLLEVEERNMIERVLRLPDKNVRAIMTPRTEISWLDRKDQEDDLRAALKEMPHSTLVVCDGSVDNVVGVVLAKDLLDRVLEGDHLALAPLVRQPIIIPDTISALDALERLRADVLGMALVMDEYGSFEGVITASDLLEAIVGDPGDAGRAPPTGAALPAGVLVLDGLMAVDELKARLVLPDLPAVGSYHTLGGLLLALLRRVPKVGDRIVFGGWRFEVAAMDGRRVERVQASPEPRIASEKARA